MIHGTPREANSLSWIPSAARPSRTARRMLFSFIRMKLPSRIADSLVHRERGEALVGLEDVGLHPVVDHGLPAELGHGAGQHHPVEQLMVAGALDLGEAAGAPGVPVGTLERRQHL